MIRRVFVFFFFLSATNYKHRLLLLLMPLPTPRCRSSSSCFCCCYYYCYGRCRCHTRLTVAFFVYQIFFFLAMILARANSFRNERSNHEKNVFPCDHTLTRTHTYTIPAHHSFQNDADDFRYHRFGHSIVFLYTCQWHVRCTLYATFFS